MSIIKLPDNPESSDHAEHITEDDCAGFINGPSVLIPSNGVIKIDLAVMKRRSVDVVSETRAHIGTIEVHKPGNKHCDNPFIDEESHRTDLTYMYTFPNGYQVVLPVPGKSDPPFFFTIGVDGYEGFFVDSTGYPQNVAGKHCRVLIEADGSISFKDCASGLGTMLEISDVLEPEEDSDVITRVDKHTLVTKKWQDIFIREDQTYLVHLGNPTEPLGMLYKIPNAANTYIFRDKDKKETYTLDPLGLGVDKITFTDEDTKSIQFRVKDDVLQVRGEKTFFCDKFAGRMSSYVDTGDDGEFQGEINGGRPIAGFTYRELGLSPFNKYSEVNEDNYRVNFLKGRIVVADGIGSGTNSQHAASLATRWIANSDKSLEAAIIDAYNAAKVLNGCIFFFKDKNPCDAVFVAAEFSGNKVDIAHTGDAWWFHYRPGEPIKRSRKHTLLTHMIEEGDITEREGYTNNKYARPRNCVTTSLLGARVVASRVFGNVEVDQVEYDRIYLQKGDVFGFCSDGADCLTDEDLKAILADGDVIKAKEMIKATISHKNEQVVYPKDFGDGLGLSSVQASMDNATVILVKEM